MSELRKSSVAFFRAGAGVFDEILNIGELPVLDPADRKWREVIFYLEGTSSKSKKQVKPKRPKHDQ